MTDTHDGARTIVETALLAAEPNELKPGKVYAWLTPTGGVQKIDLTGDEYRDTPARKTGTTTLRDADSFIAYYQKHADESSEVYADAERLTVTAVLDAHQAGADGARWGKHRAVLALRKTKAWEAWLANDTRMMGQKDFAAFLEDHLAELLEPTAAEMLEIAQSIEGTTKAQFQHGHRLQTGERQFAYVEETSATAGKGQLTIPETFVIGLVPFDGSAGYRLRARFKFEINRDGHLSLGYKLETPDDTLKTAFADVTTAITEGLGVPLLNGTPA
ncbi:DUF2303 family protein [Streptacidiphilus griseoplanus]|uniref:DUF2303 family protein n=1 Tax=Peterkaempfera griseoplana TaxID=66896 RepID=UPI0006E2DC4A|nr:DUF2303 family protein [Peterkaempfera griseoplana]